MGSGVRRISDTVLLVSPVVKQTANDQTWWVADSSEQEQFYRMKYLLLADSL